MGESQQKLDGKKKPLRASNSNPGEVKKLGALILDDKNS